MTFLRLSLVSLLLALFANETVLAQKCNSCGDPYIQKNTSSNKFINAGVEKLSCSDLVDIASQRKSFTDVCSIVQGYARKYCRCEDSKGNKAPELPYVDNTAYCNLCAGQGGSDLHTIDPRLSERFVYTGVDGFGAECQDLYRFGVSDKAFTKAQCPTIQRNTKDACGCALRDANGKEIRNTGGGNNNAPSPTPKPVSSPTPKPVSSPTPKPTPGNGGGQCVGKLNGKCNNAPCCAGLTCGAPFGNGVRYCKKGRRLRGDGADVVVEE